MDTADSEVTKKKRLLIKEIRRTAEANRGIPLGQINFSKATGIKISDWRGKLWLRWSDVLRAAGFEPNKKAHAYPEKFLIDSFIALMRELGHFPTAPELQQKGYHNPAFPSHMAFKTRWGSKVQQAEQIAQYCRRQEDYGDILAMCEEVLKSARVPARAPVQAKGMFGYVYLVKERRKWGTYYKLHWSLMRQHKSRYIGTRNGSVANYRKQESLDSQVLDFPTHDFRILPRKGNFATEPSSIQSTAEKSRGRKRVAVMP